MKYLISLLVLLTTNALVAQTPTTEQPKNPRKEVSKLMKDLPYEAQVKIWNYAMETQRAMKQMESQLTPVPAVPAPPAKPQTIELAPQSSPQLATKPANIPATPAEPKRPDYLTKAEGMAQTTVTFPETQYEFGKITEGEKVSHSFVIKNTGEQLLTLTYVRASCGCTTPNWPKEPVAPGAEAKIDVVFNSAYKRGFQNKTITVIGNFEPRPMILRIRGEVLQKPAQEGNDGN